MPARQVRIGITMGDAAGVGPEVIVRALDGGRLPKSARYVLYGSPEVLRSAAQHAGVRFEAPSVHDVLEALAGDEKLSCVNPTRLRRTAAGIGRVQVALARAAMQCISTAARDAVAGNLDAVVTAPINKTGLRRAGYPYSGHTDFLAAETGLRNVAMMFVGGGLRVVLVTIHEPLHRAIKMISTRRVFRAVELLHDALERLFGVESPRIAVCGLNPHAGEGGLMGDEEERCIVPAVKKARESGFDVTGPLPADTAFVRHRRGEFDGAVAMFHDQGLIPVKLLAFNSGVNVTLGLPFVRTSPDHGTAYDIAPRFEADPGSMEAAVRLAVKLAGRRTRTRTC